jgi:hypothetical protein
MLAGGDGGKVVVAGDLTRSRLIEAVRYKNLNLQMPPDNKLPDNEISILEQWVRMGAPWPAVEAEPAEPVKKSGRVITDEDRQFWSYQPISNIAPPTVQDNAWCESTIDRFVLAELESNGMRPAPKADKRVLLRRLSLDLTGLPPTRDELHAFLADESEEAFSKQVERLLSSPQYGERWARHWQDTVRYSDTSGLEQDRERPNTWRYRDYLIDALNDDLPVDRLLMEHIAGDLVDPRPGSRGESNVSPIGTTFLWFHEMFHMPIDPNQQRYDQIDAQIDVIGKAFLGHTLACARCHDHKFDPVTAKDYYALAGILFSTDFSMSRIAPRLDLSSIDPERAVAIREKQEELDQMRDKYLAEATKRIAKKWSAPVQITEDFMWGKEPANLAQKRADLALLDPSSDDWCRSAIESPSPVDLPVFLRGQHTLKGDLVPRRFLEVLGGADAPQLDAHASGRLFLAKQIASEKNPLTARVLVNRVWAHHFGQGIVRTVDNFGKLGEPPTHPELLDWLARKFIDSGWSMKTIHRIILNSSTWKMAVIGQPDAQAADPTNRLLHRQNLRRVDAEVLRDSILFTSRRLNKQMYGECVLTYISPNASSIRPEMIPISGPEDGDCRRSLYILVRRKNFDPLLQAFDLPDPSNSIGRRNESVVAPQALAMLNNQFVYESAIMLVRRFDQRKISNEQRLDELVEEIIARPPSDSERRILLSLISPANSGDTSLEERAQEWADVVHVIWNSADFQFVY